MSDLDALYQEILLDHYRQPRNFGGLSGLGHAAEGYNPLCGDRVRVAARLDGDRLAEVRFEGSGCAISTASASIMTGLVRGRSEREAEEIFARFRAVLQGDAGEETLAELGELAALAGVREFPMRVKCATLAWHTLRAALAGEAKPVSTE
jgi:nitrogen fixation NifU-like protein